MYFTSRSQTNHLEYFFAWANAIESVMREYVYLTADTYCFPKRMRTCIMALLACINSW